MTNLFSTLQRLSTDLHMHELLQPEPTVALNLFLHYSD